MHPKNAISNLSSVSENQFLITENGAVRPLKTRAAKVIQFTALASKDN